MLSEHSYFLPRLELGIVSSVWLTTLAPRPDREDRHFQNTLLLTSQRPLNGLAHVRVNAR
jgi:hypothetical protein